MLLTVRAPLIAPLQLRLMMALAAAGYKRLLICARLLESLGGELSELRLHLPSKLQNFLILFQQQVNRAA